MSNVIVKRRADHGDEGVDQTQASYESRSEAENWISAQEGEYYSPGAYYIVDLPYAETWQLIETAPRDGRTILAYNPYFGVYSTAFTTQWVDGSKDYRGFPCGFHSGTFGAWDCQPTHWMSLPAPPRSNHPRYQGSKLANGRQ